MVSIEELLGTVDSKLLYLVGKVLTSVVASSRIAFGVFICKNAPECHEHITAYVIFAWNQFESVALALFFERY
ncbi:hypothetical protein D9M69_572290 [compost metagenome]